MKNASAEPKEVVVRFANDIPPGPVLDLGCGIGANAFVVAHDHDVLAIDNDGENLIRLEKESSRRGLSSRITTIYADVRDFAFKTQFAAVICTNVLHFVKRKFAREIVKRMKQHTLPGGLHIVSVFTQNGQLESDRMALFENGELKGFYTDWNIVAYEEQTQRILAKNEKGEHLTHEIATLVALKPSLKQP